MMYWNINESGGSSSSSGGVSNLNNLSDVVINAPQTNQVLKYNGSKFVNAEVPGLNNLNADNITSGTIDYARLPQLNFTAGDVIAPFISSISRIRPNATQNIEIIGDYFFPITFLQIPDAVINAVSKSPSKITANITTGSITGSSISIILKNGDASNNLWIDSIKDAEVAADPYSQSVVLFVKGDGENNSTNIIDSSVNPKAITRIGNTKISTDQSKYGGGSIYFDGIGSALQIENSDDWNISLYSNYTLEYWIYIISSSGTRGIISTLLFDGSFSGWSIRQSDTSLAFLNRDNIIKSIAISTGNWHHIALVKANGSTSIFLNGISQGYIANSPTFSTRKLMIGCTYFPPQEFFNGYIDSIRITKGVARYNNNFNPETDTYLE